MRGQAPNLMGFPSSLVAENVQGWGAEGMNREGRGSGEQGDHDKRTTPSQVCKREDAYWRAS